MKVILVSDVGGHRLGSGIGRCPPRWRPMERYNPLPTTPCDGHRWLKLVLVIICVAGQTFIHHTVWFDSLVVILEHLKGAADRWLSFISDSPSDDPRIVCHLTDYV